MSPKYFPLLCLCLLCSCAQAPQTDFTVEQDLPSSIDQKHAAELNVELGLAYLERGQMMRSKEKLQHAQSLAPNLSMTHYAMGYYWERAGEGAAAENEYQRAIQLHPSGEEYNNYGAFLCRSKQYTAAEQQFLKAMTDLQYTNTATIFENAGLCALEQKDSKKAKYYLQQAIQKDPSRAKVLSEKLRGL
jgi:type IV pilus assembly protein PilF